MPTYCEVKTTAISLLGRIR